jgi:hypothetical protein
LEKWEKWNEYELIVPLLAEKQGKVERIRDNHSTSQRKPRESGKNHILFT